MMISESNLPITDWSLDGREAYLEKNRVMIELILYEALEIFGEDDTSRVFSTQQKAIENIISMFLRPDFDCSYFENADLSIFSQLNFWVKYKTKGNYSAKKASLKDDCEVEGYQEDGSTNNIIDSLAKSLNQFNNKVASDLIGFWLLANKKLLDGLSADIEIDYSSIDDLDEDMSDAKITRYKADACFRFCYCYLSLSTKISDPHKDLYEKKFLTKGSNKPQYVYKFMNIEPQDVKHRIRKYIEKIIDFHIENRSDYSKLDLILLKSIAKKTLLSHYKFDKTATKLYSSKINSLSKRVEVA